MSAIIEVLIACERVGLKTILTFFMSDLEIVLLSSRFTKKESFNCEIHHKVREDILDHLHQNNKSRSFWYINKELKCKSSVADLDLLPIQKINKIPLSFYLSQTAHTVSHPGSPVQPVLHYSNELLVGELVIVINIKDLEDGVYKMTCQLQPSGHIHRSRKLIW